MKGWMKNSDADDDDVVVDDDKQVNNNLYLFDNIMIQIID